MENDAASLFSRFDKAKSRKRTTWYSHMRECYDYAIPQRETFFKYTPGQKKNTKVFDNTAVDGVPRFANRVQKAVCPPGQQWAKLSAGDAVDEEQMIEFNGEQLTVEQALDQVTDTVFNYLHRSNFDTRVHEALTDLAVSTGALTCDYDADEDQLVFDAVPLSSIYLESGPHGFIDAVWREHDMQCRNIPLTWPEATIPEKLSEMIKKDPQAEIGVIEGMIKDHKTGSFKLHVILASEKEEIYSEDYQESSPWIPFRWTVIPGEVYGRGPLMSVLPDIKTLNAMAENMLKAAALSVSGVWTATDDGVFNPFTFRIAPGIVIPVSSNANENPTLRNLQSGATIELHEFEYKRRVDSVNRALFAQPIGGMDDPTKTATEIQIRRQMDLEDAGASFGRLQVELAGGVIRRVVSLLSREGRIPPLVIDGENVEIKYTSPISRLADVDEAQTLVQAVQMAGSMGLPPEVVMGDLKVEDIPSFLLDKLGGPSELKRSEDEKKQLQQAAGEAMAQQEQPQQ